MIRDCTLTATLLLRFIRRVTQSESICHYDLGL